MSEELYPSLNTDEGIWFKDVSGNWYRNYSVFDDVVAIKVSGKLFVESKDE